MKTIYVCHGLISPYAKNVNRKFTLKNLQVGGRKKS